MQGETIGETDAERRKRSKEVYEAVIRAVDFNSGRMQPPLASQPSVIGTLYRGRYGLDEVHRAITAARANGDLVRVRDAEGRVRLGIDDRWRLREKIDSYRRTVDGPRRDLIGLANRRVQQLRERGEDDA
ncbi:hypothetical protein [Salinilacihabitans rarus]|uniref:hypothetical protein n=1 Tax=Salinilacihabitans rarus TaxID=2961596 RepID=UPI0020C8B573|nr:hypothetical protein [Salinilacihabitans rarus]